MPCEVLLIKLCIISNFHLAECVLTRPGLIFVRQSVFRHFPGQFSVRRVCSTMSRVNFWLAECVPPVLGQFPVCRVCSAMSRVDFQSAVCVPSRFMVGFRSVECVPPRPKLISSQQSVFRHVPDRFPVGRVCSATSRVDFRLAECVPPCP